MSGRRDRVVRVARVAAETEEQARARWSVADSNVQRLDSQRETALGRAADLADVDLPIGLRSHLTGVGARHLTSLAEMKLDMLEEVEARRAELQEAVQKVRSLDRLLERIAADEREVRLRAEAAELQDLVAIRAAHKARDVDRDLADRSAAVGRRVR